MRYFIGLMAFTFAICGFGDIQSLPELKEYFSKHSFPYEKVWDKAAALTYPDITLTQPLNDKGCQDLKAKIQANYAFSPFSFKYKDGGVESKICEPETFYKAFFEPKQIKTAFGLEGAYIVQALGRGFSTFKLTYILDKNYKMLERTETFYFSKGGTAQQISSLDAEGNGYYNYFRSDDKNKDSHQIYVAANGEIPSSHRILRPRRSDKGKEIVLLKIFEDVISKDWNEYILPVNFIWFGGFYRHGNEYTDRPKSKNYFIEYFVEGKSVCSQGTVVRNGDYKFYDAPAQQAEHGHCGNSW